MQQRRKILGIDCTPLRMSGIRLLVLIVLFNFRASLSLQSFELCHRWSV